MAIMPLEGGAPPPLAPLKHTIISPANIAAEQRERNAVRIPLLKRWQMRRELKRLHRDLKQVQYAEIEARAKQLKPELQQLIEAYKTLPHDSEEWQAARKKLAKLYRQWHSVVSLIRKYQPLQKKIIHIQRALEEHGLAVNRDRLEKRLRADLRKEAIIWEQIITDRLTRLGFCHRYTKNTKEVVEKVTFSHRSLQLDRVGFKIDASYQTMFKNYKTALPEGVRVADLVDQKTLFELSIACQRQVTAVVNDGGAWIFVNRLESIDGLMNYVKYEDVMQRYPARYRDRIPVCVGVGQNREIQWINFADFPHWLIAGITKGGKSNLANVILCTLISQYTPEEVRLVLIDLKGGLEFGDYEGIPHLFGGIVDSVGKVAEALALVEAMMEQRFSQMRGVARKIEDFQAKKPGQRLPRIFVMMDEGASILGHGETTKEINIRLQQITAKGRAVGIHVVYCTQRPDKDVIKGSIKNNFAARLVGRMVTSGDSMTATGNGQAKEIAPVPGRMVMQLGPDPMQVQTPHIPDHIINESIKHAMTMPRPDVLELPPINRRMFQEWTVERVIELSIKHLGGNISFTKVYDAADGLTKSQARLLVEQIWNMEVIHFEEKQYRVTTGKGNTRWIELIE